MTQALGCANWAGNPSLCHPLMASTLRILAMLVSHLARLFRFPHPNQPAECDGVPVPKPEANAVSKMNKRSSNNNTTTTAGVAATGSDSTEGLILRTIAKAIVDSKDEAGLTGEHEQQQQQQQQQQQDNNAATPPSPEDIRAPNSLNASFSALCR